MFKSLIAKFMAKTLLSKIIIVTSTVVVIGGATAGAIIIPKQIEKHQEEQRQEQLRMEKEEDLANMTLVIKEEYRENGITLPLNGITQGFSIERYNELEQYLNDEEQKENLKNELIKIFVETYAGGELTVEENISWYERGDYPVTFTVTSEKGNTKTETVNVKVWNYFKVSVNIDKENITVNKGKNVDLMEGVTFDSNLPVEEQGHIETTGTVDVNTVGTYTITYTYIPKEGTNEGVISEKTRTYKVIDPVQIQQNVGYQLHSNTEVGSLSFNGNKFTLSVGVKNGGGSTTIVTYTVAGKTITMKATHVSDESADEACNDTYTGKLSSDGKSITVTDEYGGTLIFYL